MQQTTILTMTLAALLTTVAAACPASYVKGVAGDNAGTARHDKACQVADEYMTEKGVEPGSPAGQVIHPYVVGTTLVDDQWSGNSGKGGAVRPLPRPILVPPILGKPVLGRPISIGAPIVVSSPWGHSLDKSINECVRDSLDCTHHQQHFDDATREAGDLETGSPSGSQILGG